MTRAFALSLIVALIAAFPARAPAHHSYAEYDQQNTIEIQGTLKEVSWQNPHVRFKVLVPKGGAAPETWSIESSGINNLKRMGADVNHFKVGDKVKVAGWPSRRGAGRMYVTNLLSKDGHELVLWRFSKPRWGASGEGYGTGADKALFGSGVASKSTSLFRVWSSDYDDEDAAPEALFRPMRAIAPADSRGRKGSRGSSGSREGERIRRLRPKGNAGHHGPAVSD